MITGFYAAFLALMQIFLSLKIVKRRFKYKVSLGDGGEEDLNRHIRAHGNFIETVPMALILILCVELGGYLPWIVHWLGTLVILSRVSHAVGMLTGKGYGAWRMAGMILLFSVYILAAALCAGIYCPEFVSSLMGSG